jgi:hypothetical protein
MSSRPLASTHPTSAFVLCACLLLATMGSAQQESRYKTAGRAGATLPVLPTVAPLPPPLPRIMDASERPLPAAVTEEAWTPSSYRISGTTYVVTNTDDNGDGSLRKAILDANANSGQDLISFAIPGTGVQTIVLASALPTISDPVIIDGATQAGYAGKPLIELNGANAGIGKNGLLITGGGSIVRGLVINRFVANGVWNGFGIVLDKVGGNRIQGCYIGLDAAGTTALGNAAGIGMFGAATRNLIGGTAAAERNVISGNGTPGISDSAGGNRIINNYIGLNAAGDAALGNLWNGIYVAAPDDTIGGKSSSERNVISGNGYPGVALDPGAMRTLIQGNYFGTDVTKLHGLGNGNEAIYVSGSHNTIGGPSMSARNRIYASNLAGIAIDGPQATGNVVQGNFIGPAENYVTSMQNSIGIWVHDSPGNTIGGTVDSAGNLITLNILHGVEISGSHATGNVVQGNRIGGNSYVGSGIGNYGYGLMISNAPRNIIGGTAPYAPNFIQGNTLGGIIISGDTATGNIVQGNYIGTDINRAKGSGTQHCGIILAASRTLIGGTNPYEGNTIAYNKWCGIFDSTGSRNAFLSNLIYSNDSLSIDLAPRGITPNDSLDADDGANGLQNFPILDSADIGTGSVRIRGRMIGVPGASYSLEFFLADGPSKTHFGQGKTFLGDGSVVCDGAGNGDINVTIASSMRIDQYIAATATGSDSSTSEFSRELCMLDSDGDGILDMWETAGNGIDWNCDGKIDLDLYRMGARKDHKDIFVEVDYMTGRKPDAKSLDEVRTAFRNVPNKYLNNPDGTNGINLVVTFEDMKSPIDNVTWADPPWTEFLAAKATHFGTDKDREDPNWPNIREAKWLVYRYCIFANIFGTGDAGGTRATIDGDPTNDFLVALGDLIPDPKGVMFESSTFMHELGHSLGLQHGGGDTSNYKPNYYSIMNYLYLWDLQDPPLGFFVPKHTWKLNYSPAPLATLNENSLDESIGLDPPPGAYDVVEFPYSQNGKIAIGVLSSGTAVDWDGNGDSTGMALGPVDVNVFPSVRGASPGETLTSWADWPNLKYNFRVNGLYQRRNEPPPPVALLRPSGTKDLLHDEPTRQVYLELKKLPPFGVIERKSSWSESSLENIAIATNLDMNGTPRIATDGHRGAIICWNHGEPVGSPVYDMGGVYVQRLDSLGQAHWQNNGVWITPGGGFGGHPAITTDGEGGAIIALAVAANSSTFPPWNVYVQRIDVYGNILWGPGGVGIFTDGTSTGGEPMITSDGRGGAIIAWDANTGAVYAQRVNRDGTTLWSAGGVLVGMSNNPYGTWVNHSSALAHDAESGTVVVWEAGTSSTSVRAQRIDTSGSVRWGTNGILLSATGRYAFVLPAGGGQAFAAWVDTRAGTTTPAVYAQRLDTAGTFLWGGTGLPVDVTPKGKSWLRLTPDSKGGVIAAWFDYRNDPSPVAVYGQRISGTGTLLWPSTSVCFADSVPSTYSSALALLNDCRGGGIAIYPKRFGPSFSDMYAQHVDSAGNPQWGENGVAVCSAGQDQFLPVAISDGVGGAIAAWQDARLSKLTNGPSACVFAQLVNRTGGLGGTLVTAVAEKRSAVPESFRLYQNYPNPFNPSTTIEYDLPVQSKVVIRVYDILGRQVQELKNGIEPAGRGKFAWNPQNRLASGVYFCRIEATGTGQATQTRVTKMLLMK